MDKSRKQKILETSLNLFYKHGISSVTMDEIAISLKVSKKTLYKDFGSKEHLVEAIAKLESRRLQESINQLILTSEASYPMKAKSICDAWLLLSDRIMPIFFKDLFESYTSTYDLIKQYQDMAVNNRFKDFLEQSAHCGALAPFVILSDTVAVYKLMFDNFLIKNIANKEEVEENRFAKEMAYQLRVLLRGISSDVHDFDQCFENQN